MRGKAAVDGAFVGRREQLAELERALAEARQGRGGFWLLLGEPGIGKTRLAEELARNATHQGVAVAWGRCWEGGGAPPFLPWTQAFASLGITDVFAAAHASNNGGHHIDADADADAARFRLFETAAATVRNAANARPLLIALDDLHEADDASLLMLRFLAVAAADMPMLLVGTWRDTVPVDVDTARAGRTLHVPALELAEVAEFVDDAAAAPPLLAASGGNPLFLRALVDSGMTTAVPTTVREAIRQRASALTDEAADALHAAAVLGSTFDAGTLATLLAVPRADALHALAEAERERLVHAVDDGGALTFRFTHGLVRETLYATLGPARRIHLHGAAAAALATRPDVEPSIVSHHYFRAGDGPNAVAFAQRAAASALRRMAFEEAASQYERALQALALGPPRDGADHDDARDTHRLRCDLCLGLAEARWRIGDAAAARSAFAEALDAADQAADPERYATAALGHAGPPEAAEFDIALAAPLRRALEVLPPDPSPLRLRVEGRLSDILFNTGRTEEATRLSEHALAGARASDDPATLAYVLRCRFYNVWEPDLDARLADTAALIDSGVPELEVVARCWRAAVHLARGDVAAFDVELGFAGRLAHELGQPYLVWLVTVSAATRAALDGRFAEAEQLAIQAAERGPNLRAVLDGFGVQLVFLRYLTGEFTDLEPVVRAAVDEFPTSPVRRAALALLLAEAGRLDEARAEFERLAHADFADVPHDFVYLLCLHVLGLLCGTIGDTARAQALYDLLLPYADWNVVAGVSSGFLGSVSLSLGVLARALQRPDDAERHLADAEERHVVMGARPWIALTRCEQASLRDDAALMREVAAAADALGMKALHERARAHTAPGHSDRDDDAAAYFRREGQFWSVSFAGKVVRLRDVKGVRDIARLVASPNHEVHVLELAGSAAGTPGDMGTATVDPVLDERAKAELRRRVAELEQEIDEAASWSDEARAARAREELDFLLHELAGALGLGGRDRALGAPAERARKAVKARIDDALGRIAHEHPELATHLRRSIKTGTFCVYTPVDPVSWTV